MSRYLVVAFETMTSPELRAALTQRAHIDPEGSFGLLVPATPRRHLLVRREGEAKEIAGRMADSAKSQLELAGLTVRRAIVGRASPLTAIADELAADPGYSSIIICTHPADISRWLRAGVPVKAQQFGLPVTHIVVKSVVEAAGFVPVPAP